jgi:glyoxylate reductase
MMPPRPSVLVTRRLPAAVLDQLRTTCDVDLHNESDALPRDVLCARLEGKQGLVCMFNDPIDAGMIAAGGELQVVATVAVGYDNIDIGVASARGIVVTNTPETVTGATAELTWALILAITRRVGEGDRIVRAEAWKGWSFDFLLGTELRGKQLGIVGGGRIGRATAAVAPAFGMRAVFATREGVRAGDAIEGWPVVSLDELLHTSDVVSLHVPLTDATRHLINRRTLMRMKRSAYLVNASRGGVVDDEALAWALEERLIAGAGLDVYEDEPDICPDLRHRDNACLTPHLGSATRETRTAMAELAVRNVIAVLSGQPAITPVNG